MMVKQLAVFLENKKGRLMNLVSLLAKNGIDLYALSIADTTDFGILRALTNDTDKATAILKEAGYMVNVTEVISAEVPDVPGGLASVLAILDSNGISIEYLYSFVKNSGTTALILFRVSDTEKAVEVLKNAGIKLVSKEELDAM